MIEASTLHAPDGFPLAVQTQGPAGAPALLLLPGQANSHHWWDAVRAGYAEAFRTVTVDYRGTGGSRGDPGEPGDWSTSLFAADAVAALDHLGIGTAAVFGTSMGGKVAQQVATEHRERVTALVLGCTSPGGPHAVERPPATRRRLARGTPEEQLVTLHELFHTPEWPGTPEQSTLLGDPTMSPREQVGHRRASDRHDAWDVLPTITVPTLVLHGTGDEMVPAENAALLADRIPDARLRLFPGGRHGFFEEEAEEVTDEVLRFLAGVA